MTEEWRACPLWPHYEISNCGGIRRVVPGRAVHCQTRKPYLATTGYFYIKMWNGKTRKVVGIHQLVAEAFIGPSPSPTHQVAHADGTRTNNDPSNLRWATRSENEGDKVLHGRSNRGSRQGRAVLDERDVGEIVALILGGETNVEVAARYGVARQTVNSIRVGRSWTWLTLKHPGFVLQAVTERAAA